MLDRMYGAGECHTSQRSAAWAQPLAGWLPGLTEQFSSRPHCVHPRTHVSADLSYAPVPTNRRNRIRPSIRPSKSPPLSPFLPVHLLLEPDSRIMCASQPLGFTEMPGFDSITDQQLDAFKVSLRTGQYNLLLGSGVSLDSHNARGALPCTETLRRDLCTFKNAHANTTLQRVFQLLTKDEVATQVTSRFVNCTAGPSVELLPSFVWKRIFSFNIDDAVESAYSSESSMQALRSLNYTDTYEESGPLTEVSIIHLHGFAKRGADGYVFSIQDYVRSMRDSNAWMLVLSQHIPSEPFILVGTSLNEPDLEYYLAARRTGSPRADRGPSVFVSPDPDSVTRHDCERFHLTLFHGTALDFFNYCEKNVPTITPQQLIPIEQRRLLPSTLSESKRASFWADFDLVPAVVDATDASSVPRFLYGHPPTWSDLSAGYDVARPVTRSVTAKIQKPSHDPDTRLIIILDRPGSGKTTILNRVAFELARAGRAVLHCTSLSRLEPIETVEALNALGSSPVVVVDDFAAQATPLASILEHNSLRRDIIIVGAERSYRENYLKEALGGAGFLRFTTGRINPDDVTALVDRYFRFGVLGTREALSPSSDLSGQLLHDPIAVACCRILNDFRPLDRIVIGVFNDSNTTDQMRFVVAAIAQFCFPAGIRYDVLASIIRRPGFAQQLRAQHALPLTFTTDEQVSFIAPENATLAEQVLVHCSRQEPSLMLETFVSLANGIAPRVNPKTIRRRAPEARLASRLFDLDGPVRRFLGIDRATSFYRRTRDAWQWNSRYWGQCALLELERFYADPYSSDGSYGLDLAVQHARHAVAIERHHFPLTTLGQVLLAQMTVEGPTQMSECFSEAFSALSDAIETERNRVRMAVQPFIVMFRGTTDFVAAGGQLSTGQISRLQSIVDAADYRFGRDAKLKEVLDMLRNGVDAIV